MPTKGVEVCTVKYNPILPLPTRPFKIGRTIIILTRRGYNTIIHIIYETMGLQVMAFARIALAPVFSLTVDAPWRVRPVGQARSVIAAWIVALVT